MHQDSHSRISQIYFRVHRGALQVYVSKFSLPQFIFHVALAAVVVYRTPIARSLKKPPQAPRAPKDTQRAIRPDIPTDGAPPEISRPLRLATISEFPRSPTCRSYEWMSIFGTWKKFDTKIGHLFYMQLDRTVFWI